MSLPSDVDTLLKRMEDLNYQLVDRKDFDDRTVVWFKRPRGLNVGAATVFADGVVLGDYSPSKVQQ